MSSNVQELMSMGFTESVARKAVTRYPTDIMQAVEYALSPEMSIQDEDQMPGLINGNEIVVYDKPETGPAPKPADSFDADVDKAIALSLISAHEPDNPHERRRTPGVPVGLKNIGNICYFNTILQSYYAIPAVRAFVLSLSVGEPTENDDLIMINFLHHLHRLFGYMMLSDRKYVDPKKVITAMLANSNRKIGEQEDPTEFNHIFLDALEEGLKAYNQESQSVMVSGANLSQSQEGTKTFIERMFNVKQVETVLVHNSNADDPTIEEQETNVIQIIVNVSSQNLYAALDEYTGKVTIDDYSTEEGKTASKLTSFSQYPAILSFLCQRLEYNKETKSAVKINSSFEFPESLSLGRYDSKNLTEVLKRREKISALQHEIDYIRKEQSHLCNYMQEGVGIDMHFAAVINYLMKQGVDIPVLEEKLSAIQQELARLSSEIKIRQDQIDHIFDDLDEGVYSLHAVMVHEGTATSGHYWAFIYDHVEGQWFKHNDATVEAVDAEVVWKESVGGNESTASAYCLMYVDRSRVEAPDEDSAYLKVPIELQAEIAEDSNVLMEEIVKWDLDAAARAEKERQMELVREPVAQFVRGYRQKLQDILVSSGVTDLEDPRMRSFNNWIMEVESQDTLHTLLAADQFREMFPGEELQTTDRHIFKEVLCSELPSVILENSEDEIRAIAELRQQYELFLEVARNIVHGLYFWSKQDYLSAVPLFLNGLKIESRILSRRSRRNFELRESTARCILYLSERTKDELCAGYWEDGLRKAFMISVLCIQNYNKKDRVYNRLRNEWMRIMRQLNLILNQMTVPETLAAIDLQFRTTIKETLTVYESENKQSASRYTLDEPEIPSDVMLEGETMDVCYHRIKSDVWGRFCKDSQIQALLREPEPVKVLPPHELMSE